MLLLFFPWKRKHPTYMKLIRDIPGSKWPFVLLSQKFMFYFFFSLSISLLVYVIRMCCCLWFQISQYFSQVFFFFKSFYVIETMMAFHWQSKRLRFTILNLFSFWLLIFPSNFFVSLLSKHSNSGKIFFSIFLWISVLFAHFLTFPPFLFLHLIF